MKKKTTGGKRKVMVWNIYRLYGGEFNKLTEGDRSDCYDGVMAFLAGVKDSGTKIKKIAGATDILNAIDAFEEAEMPLYRTIADTEAGEFILLICHNEFEMGLCSAAYAAYRN